MNEPPFVPGVKGEIEDLESREAWIFAFQGRRLLVYEQDRSVRAPRLADLGASSLEPSRRLYLGKLHGRPVIAAEIAASAEAPAGMAFRGLRSLYTGLDDLQFTLAGRAIQIVDWDRDHQYCGRCATPTEDTGEERSKRCPNCGLVFYPRLSPAVIVLVRRGDEILLARSPHFPPGMYSTLAGFVEPGETLEETVLREIEEEVGVIVDQIRYFGSQPWPFPNSLMVGFTARYKSGALRIFEGEIEDAEWFTRENLPKIPPKISIARALIDSYLEA